MEYAFRNDADGTLMQIELNKFQLVVREGGQEKTIPYAAITAVYLKKQGTHFSIQILSTNYCLLKISNQHQQTKEGIEQSAQYNTFVKILHYYLNNTTSSAEFRGTKQDQLIEKTGVIIILSIITYFIESVFNIFPLGPLITAFLLFGLGTLLVIGPAVIAQPKPYSPTDIPLNLLPPVQ